MNSRPRLFAPSRAGSLLLGIALLPWTATAQGPVVPPPGPATETRLPGGQLEAGDAIRNIYALPQASGFRQLIELSADRGVPQPTEWRAVSHDPNSATLLHAWWADASSATDEGEPDIPYSQDPPSGFVNLDRWNVDSGRAFSIAEAAAAEAGVGFDSADYTLRAQELTNEPLWIIGLSTRRGNRVGTVYLSAETGQIKRTIWIDSSLRRRGFSGIEDSALTGQVPSTPATPALPPASLPPVNSAPATTDPGLSVDPGLSPTLPPVSNPATPATSPSRTPGQPLTVPPPTPRPDPRATIPRGSATPSQTPATPPATTPPAANSGLLPGEVPAVNN